MIGNNRYFFALTIVFILFSVTGAQAQLKWLKKKQPVDTCKSKNNFENFIKQAKIDSGVINVIKDKNDYYFELDTTLFNRDFLVVNKLSQVPYALNDAGLNKGINYENILIRFIYNPLLKKIFVVNYKAIVSVPKKDKISTSVADNYRKSILESFNIAYFNKDSSSVIFKVNKIYDGHEKSLNNIFGMTGLGTSPDVKLSYISNIKSFQKNIIAKSILTTSIPAAETASKLSVEVTSNLVLLNRHPMSPRFSDPRIGYFTTPKLYFNDQQQKVEKKRLITRWNLIPKDKKAYLKGKLTEPEHPIIFYIDPATPEQWRPYIKEGIEQWNTAFECAGFKNAIQCRSMPDSISIDLDDIRYSGITYAASDKANAMGPSVVDPRSGEIIEADVMWWHNVLKAVHNWMRVQTGIIDSASRGNVFSDQHMGEAVRFICSHEIGHTLGLKHNMGGSSFYPTDSLRSEHFTALHGTATSIMDYARFNYVAQPEDHITQLYPRIGEYDKFAINWGYRYYGKDQTQDLYKSDSLLYHAQKNPLLTYLPQQDRRNAIDPRAQSEDLGDNSIKSSLYGIENLKRIVPLIIQWTTKKGENYSNAGKLYTEVISQWLQYSYHVLANVGGIYLNNTTLGDGQKSYDFVPKNRQKQAVDYLINQVFTTQDWLFKNNLGDYIFPLQENPAGITEINPTSAFENAQSYIFWDLLTNNRLNRMLAAEAQLGSKNAYTVSDLLSQLHHVLFSQTIQHKSLSIDQRASQKAFVDALIIAVDRSSIQKVKKSITAKNQIIDQILNDNEYHCYEEHEMIHNTLNSNRIFGGPSRISDAISQKRGELLRIEKLLKQNRHFGNWATQSHYEDLLLRINQSLR